MPTSFLVAALDSYAERITTALALIGGILMLPALFWFLSGIGISVGVSFNSIVVSVATSVAVGAWLLLNYAVQPTSYVIEQERLVIKRRWVRPMRLEFKDMLGVSEAAGLADVPRRGLRRSFNAGVFGYQGPFDLQPYGQVFFVATNREKLVAVALHNRRPLVLSPARPRPFIEALREALLKRNQPDDQDSGDTNAFSCD